jgi:hypothetical protein
MISYRTTQLGVLLCGGKVKEDTYACLLTRCNKFLKFAVDNSPLITVVSIHEKVKRLIMTDQTVSANIRIYDHLLSTSVDTLSMVKKADALVIKHQAKMQTAEANLKSAQDLLSPKEWKAMISSSDLAPIRAALPAREEESGRSGDRTPSSKTKSVAFAAVRPSSPTPQVIMAASTVTHPSPVRAEGGNTNIQRRTASVTSGTNPCATGNGAAQQAGRNFAETRLLATIKC